MSGHDDIVETCFQLHKENDIDGIDSLLLKDKPYLLRRFLNILENKQVDSNSTKQVYESLLWLNEHAENVLLQLTSTLVWKHYHHLTHRHNQLLNLVNTLLLSVYNKHVNNLGEGFTPVEAPDVTLPSIYHQPFSGVEKFGALNTTPTHIVSPQYHHIISTSTRTEVVCQVWKRFNEKLSSCSYEVLQATCSTIYNLSACGYHGYLKNYPRFKVTTFMMKEFLQSLHFCLYHGLTEKATETLEELHRKACDMVCPESILVTEALLHSIKLSSQQPNTIILPFTTFKPNAKEESSVRAEKVKMADVSLSFSESADDKTPLLNAGYDETQM